MNTIFSVVTILILLTSPVYSSQEGALPISEFLFKSEGIEDSGIIIVEGEKDADGIFTKLQVNDFGKTFDISVVPLKAYPVKAPNGIQLSYNGNNMDSGGRTVYIDFTIGTWKESTKRAFMVVVSEDGKPEIYIRTQRKP
jgi:hypothetical protein